MGEGNASAELGISERTAWAGLEAGINSAANKLALLERLGGWPGEESCLKIDRAHKAGMVRALGKQLGGGAEELETLIQSNTAEWFEAQYFNWWATRQEQVGSDFEESVVKELLRSLIVGENGQLHRVMAAEVTRRLEQSSNKPLLTVETEGERKGLAKLEMDFRTVLGAESPVVRFMAEYGLALDTPFAWMMQLTDEEVAAYGRSEMSAGQIWKLMSGCEEVVSLGHGFSGSRQVWDHLVPVLSYGTAGMRRAVVAWSTKGAEGTLMRHQGKTSGGMVDGAAQIEMGLRMWGLLGEKTPAQVVHVGHSMGGREALYLPLLAGLRSNLKVVAVSPVVGNTPRDLRLIYGQNTKEMLEGKALYTVYKTIPESLPVIKQLIAELGLDLKITPRILREMVVSGDTSLDDARQLLIAHALNFREVDVIYAQLHHLLTEGPLPLGLTSLMAGLYGEHYAGILAGGVDLILGTDGITEALAPDFGEKYRVVVGGAHHVWLILAGLGEFMTMTNDAFEAAKTGGGGGKEKVQVAAYHQPAAVSH